MLKHDYLLHEETARIFCEAAFYCYFLGMNSEGYRLQQQVSDILCAMKKSICFYKGDELMKVARVLRPRYDPGLLVLKLTAPSVETTENVIGRTGVKIGTTQNSELLEGIEMIEPKAREAFSRGDYQASSDLYTEIVNLPVAVYQPCVRPLGTIFCNRGIVNMQLKNVETALEDFNASIYADTELYRVTTGRHTHFANSLKVVELSSPAEPKRQQRYFTTNLQIPKQVIFENCNINFRKFRDYLIESTTSLLPMLTS